MITDSTGTKRVFLGKSAITNGAMARYYVYTPGGTYNTDKNVAVIRRMSLYENELTNQHIISIEMGIEFISGNLSSQELRVPLHQW